MSLPALFELSNLNGSNGFALNGIKEKDGSDLSVSSAGDFNGDGFDDLIIGARRGNTYDAGESYVVFGQGSGFAPSLNLSDLDGTSGFALNGIDAYDGSGTVVSGAGDVNGDGFDDIIIGASGASPNGKSQAGESYVVFGRSEKFAPSFNLSDLNGANGFILNGIDEFDESGHSVSGAGDVNGDGFDDIIVGAHRADSKGQSYAGDSYVVFGQGGEFAPSLNLSDLNGTNGFILNGLAFGDSFGWSVSGAGDVNGDGFDDIIIGAQGASPNGKSQAGESYVVFGRSGGFSPSFNLSDLNGANGFILNGIDIGDASGWSVSDTGDINGDGFGDFIIGAFRADSNEPLAGKSYVVFGQDGGFAPSLNLSDLNGTNGFTLNGIDAYDSFGWSVSGAGDVNGDGFDDFIIGAAYADPNGKSRAGESYVVFGRSGGFVPSFDLSNLNEVDGFILNGIDPYDSSGWSVSGAGDINGDGFDDLIIGAQWADPNGQSSAGESYVIFGQSSHHPGSPIIGSPTSNSLIGTTEGEIIRGLASNDTLRGQEGQDTLFGNRGDDLLIGNQGRDRLIGGYGLDTLIGGAAADKFVLQGTQSGADRIVDFNMNNDLILVRQSGFDTSLTIGTLAGAQFAVGSAAITSNTQFIYDDQTGILSFDVDGNGSQAASAIAFLTPNLDLTTQNIRVF